MGGPRAMRSYQNAERGLSRVNSQVKQGGALAGIFANRWVMIGGAVSAAAPLLVRLSGSVVQLVGSLVQAAGGAGVVGGGALGAFIVGIGSVALVVKGLMNDLKPAQQAFAAYNTAVTQYGARSRQAATEQLRLNAALQQAPRGTLALLQNVKAIGNEWERATKRSREYLIQTANFAIGRARAVLPQAGAIVNANVRATAGSARGMIDRLLDPSNLSILARVSATFRRDLPPAADAATNLALSFGRLIADAGPFVRQFLVMIDRWTQHLDIATRDTTYMQYRMHELVAEFRNWIGFLQTTWHLMEQLFRAATLTHTSLHGITGVFQEWTRWLQNNPLRVARFFQQSQQGAHDLGAALMFVLRLFAHLSTSLDPVWQAIRQIIGGIAGPLMQLLNALARTISILGAGIGGIGGPLAILLRVATGFLTVVNTLLSRIPALGAVLSGVLTVYGLVRMVNAIRSFFTGTQEAAGGMSRVTAQTNMAAAATERLAAAQRMTGGVGIPFRAGATNISPATAAGMAETDLYTAAAARNARYIPVLGTRLGGRVMGGVDAGMARLGAAPGGARFAVGSGGQVVERGLLARLGGAGMARLGLGSLRGAAGVAGIATLLGSTALSMIPGVPRGVQRYASDIGTGAAIGSMAGLVGGPLAPITAPIGALIGGGIGALYAGLTGGGGRDVTGIQNRHMQGFNQRVLTGYRNVPTRTGVTRVPIYGRTIHHAGVLQQLNRFGGMNAHTAAQVSGEIGVLQSALRGGFVPQAQQAQYQAQLQNLRSVLPQVRQQERHSQFTQAFGFGQNLMRGFNVVSGAQGPQAAMTFVRQQALAEWGKLGPEGRKVLADGLLSWASQMRQANPALAGQFTALKNSIIGNFVQIHHGIQAANSQIVYGTASAWKQIAAQMANPVEQARESISANLTLIQQKAVASLHAMGFTPGQAQALVSSIEGGGAAGAAASAVASGTLGYGAFTGITSGGAATQFHHGPSGGPGGPGRGPSRVGGLHRGIRTLAADVMARFPALQITSGLRPGDTSSYHSLGEAVDLAGPGMGSAAGYIARHFGGSLLEGIHNSGLSVKNGSAVDPSFWGASTWAQHANHIHLAVGDAFAGGGGGARGSLPGSTATAPGRVTLGQLAPGLSGVRALPGLLTDSTGLLMAGAMLARVNAAVRSRTGRTAGRAVTATATSNVQRLGQQMAASRGWTGANWNALHTLWMGESGWNPMARNPSSGAFGIPQALPPSKMGMAAMGGDPISQIAWGLNYIGGRYGTPSRALSAWQSRSPHWYGAGGDFIARRPQLIGVGDSGAERVTVTPLRGGKIAGRASGISVQVHIARIDATGGPGSIRETVRNEIRDAIADVSDELDRTGYAPEESLL